MLEQNEKNNLPMDEETGPDALTEPTETDASDGGDTPDTKTAEPAENGRDEAEETEAAGKAEESAAAEEIADEPAIEIAEEAADEADSDSPDASDEDDEYDSYEDDVVEDDDENFAAVAERITGARHTQATTAAPVRTREATGHIPTVPKATAGIPVREAAEEHAEPEPTETTESSPAGPLSFLGDKKTFVTLVASACALILLLVAIIVVANVTAKTDYPSSQPADLIIGETYDKAEAIVPGTDTKNPDNTDDTDDTDNTEESTGESAAEETDPQPETQPETQPVATRFTVTIDFFDKEDITVVTEAIVLSELLSQAGCKLEEADVPSVPLDSLIAASTTITIDKHTWVSETVTEEIPYTTEQIDVDTIPRGTTNWIQTGENGVITKTYTVEYINGVEVNRTLASEETTKWPVTAKYEYGVGGSFIGGDGNSYTYSYRMVVRATYYNWEGLTYLGTYVDDTTLAVDPALIPLGTELYVKNDKYDFGYRIANDTGGDIKGDWIDIWISKEDAATIHKEFCNIGFHYDMEVYFID